MACRFTEPITGCLALSRRSKSRCHLETVEIILVTGWYLDCIYNIPNIFYSCWESKHAVFIFILKLGKMIHESNIFHLEKRKIIWKSALGGDMLLPKQGPILMRKGSLSLKPLRNLRQKRCASDLICPMDRLFEKTHTSLGHLPIELITCSPSHRSDPIDGRISSAWNDVSLISLKVDISFTRDSWL